MRINLIYLGVLLLIVSCSEGESIHEIQDAIYLRNNDLYYSKSCYSILNVNFNDGMVITTEEEYEELANAMRKNKADLDPYCDTASVLDINFNKHSLIGIYTGYGTCDTIKKKILLNESSETITYSIDIKKYTGPCNYMLVINLNLALIPKISENYNVDFSINEHY